MQSTSNGNFKGPCNTFYEKRGMWSLLTKIFSNAKFLNAPCMKRISNEMVPHFHSQLLFKLYLKGVLLCPLDKSAHYRIELLYWHELEASWCNPQLHPP